MSRFFYIKTKMLSVLLASTHKNECRTVECFSSTGIYLSSVMMKCIVRNVYNEKTCYPGTVVEFMYLVTIFRLKIILLSNATMYDCNIFLSLSDYKSQNLFNKQVAYFWNQQTYAIIWQFKFTRGLPEFSNNEIYCYLLYVMFKSVKRSQLIVLIIEFFYINSLR